MRTLALLAVLGSCGRLHFDPLRDGDSGTAGDAGAVRIQSVQRGAHVMTTTPLTVDITPVDPLHTFVYCDFRTADSGAARMPTCELTSPTTVVITTGILDTNVVVGLQVIELAGGVRVQRGSEPFVAGADLMRLVPIAPVQLDRAFAVVTRRTSYEFDNFDQRFAVAAELRDATTLALTRDATGTGSLDVVWQVIELEGASVLAGTTMIVNTMSTAALARNVDPAVTFVITSARGGSGVEGEALARAVLSSTTTITVTRNVAGATPLQVAWFAVELPQARVNAGTTPIIDQPITNAVIAQVDPSRSFVISSLSGGLAGLTNHLDAAACTADLTAQNLALHRGMNTDVGGMVAWFVVEGQP